MRISDWSSDVCSSDLARTRRVDGDAGLLGRPFDDDAGDAGLGQTLLEILADLQLLVQQTGILLVAGIPARAPGAVDAAAGPDRMDVVTRYACAPLCCASACFGFAAVLALAGAFCSSVPPSQTTVTVLNGSNVLSPRPRPRPGQPHTTN